jgi:FkbM family methyltransferase
MFMTPIMENFKSGDELPRIREIYNAVQDDISKNIFKHRLLYSLFGEENQITKIVSECLPSYSRLFESAKICLYGAGAGAGAGWIIEQMGKRGFEIPFIIDKYKKGKFGNYPIISLEEFLKLSDRGEYLIVITVGKGNIRDDIKTELKKNGLKYLCAYYDLQYFDLEHLNLRNEYFVDAGAFDGETTKYFFEICPDGHSYLFEPNPEQFKICKENLKNFPGAEFFQYGLYDENVTLCFDTRGNDMGSAKITKTGDIEIEARRLDDLLLNKKVTFIKMDIEGTELNALKGAEKIIRGQKPKLAICVYHKSEDIWEIPELILNFNAEYKLYLRHYTISNTETVLYAIP